VKRRVETHTASAQDSEPRFLGDGVPDPGIGGCKEPLGSRPVQYTEVISVPGSPRRARSPTLATELAERVFVLVLPSGAPGALRNRFCYPRSLVYSCSAAATAVATLPDVFSMTSSPNWRAFRRSALICFSFISASYCS
jgi:hypothetical protein